MNEKILNDISKKLNILIALALRQLPDEQKIVAKKKRQPGIGALARYLSSMGLDAKDISDITGAPLQSIRTLLTPQRRK